ncbi:Gfo/Idh/MocA family protein [Fibrobacterota bacterium]
MSLVEIKKKRFLVIGCGSIGKRHIGNLLKLGVEDITAFDIDKRRLEEVEAGFKVKTLDSLEKAYESSPFAALITAPTNLHLPLAVQAAGHGCHLFIEKPLSHNLDGVDELLDIVKVKKLITLVGCNMHFHPGLRKVKELIDQGVIGNIVSARVEFGQYLPDWHPEEDYRKNYSARKELGGGIILDAIHELDYIRWLLGEVTDIACFFGKLSNLEIETEDTASMLLRFKSGAIGEVHVDYVQREYSRTCKITGNEGTITWDVGTACVRCFKTAKGAWEEILDFSEWNPNHMYLDEMNYFLNCPEQDVIEGYKVLQLAVKAKE